MIAQVGPLRVEAAWYRAGEYYVSSHRAFLKVSIADSMFYVEVSP